MSYQYIETLSDEAVKRYQSADFCFHTTSVPLWKSVIPVKCE